MSSAYPDQGDSPDALVWVFIIFYFLFLLGIAVYSWWDLRGLSKESMKDQLAMHYLAGHGLGDVVLALTVFSTVFSGYTVVGVPEETYKAGFFAYRWLFLVTPIILPIAYFGDKLRSLGKTREYISPADFVGDRYNSHLLKVVISFGLAFPAMVYVLAQFKTMGATIHQLSDGKIDDFDAATVFCVIMLCYEVFGGLRAIAWTDALQGGVMFFGFLCFFGVQEELFGGVEEAGNYIRDFAGGNTLLTQLLSEDWQSVWFAFGTLIFFAFCFYPQMIQRYQAASSSASLKKTCIFLFIGTWLAMASSLATGMVAMKYFGFRNPNIPPNEVFASIMRVTMNSGFGYNILGSTLITASLAAFMSTADSAINGCSCCLTVDILKPYPWIWKCWCGEWAAGGCADTLKAWFGMDITSKEWTDSEIVGGGKLISIIVAITALFLTETDYELGPLFTMQNAVLCQVFPVYFMGMITDFVKPLPSLVGFLTGFIMVIVVQCDGADNCERNGMDITWYWPIDRMHPAMFAMMLNLAIQIVFSFIPIEQPEFDKITAENEFPKDLIGLNTCKGNAIRPYHWPYNLNFLAIVIVGFFAVPWYRNEEEPHVEEFVGGLPEYIRTGYWVTALGTFLGFVSMLCFWSGEDDEFLDHPWPICLWAPTKESVEDKQNESGATTSI